MNLNKKTVTILEDPKVNVKIKLSILWVTIMFLYLYVDYFGLYTAGHIERIIAGEVHIYQITQGFLFTAMLLVTIPILMVFLSLALKPKVNRWVNIIVGVLQIVINVGMAIGETYIFYLFGTIVEVVLLLLIIWYAWKWPKMEYPVV